MPRMTRAALRSNALLEENKFALSTPLPPTPTTKRTPLGEIVGNANEVVSALDELEKLTKEEHNPPTKRKRGRATKTKKPEEPVIDKQTPEVLEDDNQSCASSAVEEACSELINDHSSGILVAHRFSACFDSHN